MKRDEEYNLFKKRITELHQSGFRLARGMTEFFYDDSEDETQYITTIQMYKHGNHERDITI